MYSFSIVDIETNRQHAVQHAKCFLNTSYYSNRISSAVFTVDSYFLNSMVIGNE